MKTVLLILILAAAFSVRGQNKKNVSAVKVVYKSFREGKESRGPGMTIIYRNDVAFLSDADDKIRDFIDYGKKRIVTILNYENELYKTLSPFDSLPKPVAGKTEETILGYPCKYAVLTSFSNKIEIWYSEKNGAKGSPYLNYIPDDQSLVLKIVINGNRNLTATSIEKIEPGDFQDYPLEKAKTVSTAELEELKIKSRYSVITVFENERINFENNLEPPGEIELELNKTYRFSKGSVILKKIKLPESWKKGGQIFARLTGWSDGDAYDRTGSVFIIPGINKKNSMLNALLNGVDVLPVFTDNKGMKYQGITKTDDYDPPVEIMRFFTSFGVRYFNTRRVINNYPWKDAAVYKEEVTSLIPDEDEIWIGVFIGNYDKGGHMVNLELDFYPSFEEEKAAKRWIQPLFYTVNIMEMSGQNYGRLFRDDTLSADFEVPENVEKLQLLYTSTGHGGWGGGDEFNPKINRVFIDGKPVYEVIPWRTDCATYRLYNPASGNFGNGLSSSDLSRSNWCPGTLTPPYLVPLKNIEPGTHTIQVVIDQGEDEGGSFSHWGVSGILTGNVKSN